MMSCETITWVDTIDEPWLGMEAIQIGGVSAGLGAPDKFILLSYGDQPKLRVDVYPSSEEYIAFNDAIIWHGFLVVGWNDCAYLIDIESGVVTKHSLGSYFGHIYAGGDYLLIASGERLSYIRRDGSLHWMSEILGVDGVVVDDVADGVISGDGEWDPPGGWRPFRIRLDNGHHVK